MILASRNEISEILIFFYSKKTSIHCIKFDQIWIFHSVIIFEKPKQCYFTWFGSFACTELAKNQKELKKFEEVEVFIPVGTSTGKVKVCSTK